MAIQLPLGLLQDAAAGDWRDHHRFAPLLNMFGKIERQQMLPRAASYRDAENGHRYARAARFSPRDSRQCLLTGFKSAPGARAGCSTGRAFQQRTHEVQSTVSLPGRKAGDGIETAKELRHGHLDPAFDKMIRNEGRVQTLLRATVAADLRRHRPQCPP